MMPMSLVDKTTSFVEKNGLFSAPCRVVVGVSGGADSMALLHVLMQWKTPLQIFAVHVHHGFRGESADSDERLVRDFCDKHHVPLTVFHSDVAAYASENRMTFEEAGRHIRYARFEEVRQTAGADWVLTAHTADDQVETILMHLVRGCGVDGLTGIPPMRGRIRRPFLCCTRADIERYCEEYSVPYVVDETNADVTYTRNYVRHRVLPTLREMNPAVGEALLRLSHHATEDCAYFDGLVDKMLSRAQCGTGYRADAIVSQPSALRRRILRRMMRDSGVGTIEAAHIKAAEDVLARGVGSVSLPDGYVFSVEQCVGSVWKQDEACLPSILSVKAPCTVAIGGQIYSVYEGMADSQNVHNLLFKSTMDYDKIVGELHFRCRRVGDYLHPTGRGVGKSIKKLMNEWHIPAHIRDSYPLLCDDAGVVLVPGFACDERVRVTDTTKHYLVCETYKMQG